MATTRNVVVKWGKNKFDLTVDLNDPVEVFKAQLYTVSGVPMERQKIMGVKGGTLKDGASWKALDIKEGQVLMMVGTAETIQEPIQKTVFVEDMAPSEVAAQMALLPPGIRNLGNTCYMNATIQFLHAIPELQTMLIQNPVRDNEMRSQLVKSLSSTFGMLNHSNQPIVPFEFYTCLRAAYPQFAEVDEKSKMPRQQDAEECWTSVFMSVIQQTQPNSIKEHFVGEYESRLTCKEAPSEPPSVTHDPFYKLSCNIDNNISHMYDGLKLNLIGEIEKNSPTLNRTAVYTKTQMLSKIPYYLTVQFVRFFWKKAAQGKAKITKPVGIPQTLDLYDLCTPDLQKKLIVTRRAILEKDDPAKQHQQVEPSTTTETTTTTSTVTPMESAPVVSIPATDVSKVNDTGQYELIAVLTHKGMFSEGGHYVTWIKQDNDTWLLFDDDKVRVADPAEIAKLDGKGGAEWHIAYLCLYRTKPHPAL